MVTVPIYSANQVDEAVALFAKRSEYILDIEVIDADGGDPKCAGYVTVDPAKKYYYATDGPVELTANPQPGHRFLGWDGDFPLIPHQPTPEIEVDVAALGTDWTIRAIFAPEAVVVNFHFDDSKVYPINPLWLNCSPEYIWGSSTGDIADLTGKKVVEVLSFDVNLDFQTDVLPFLQSGNEESDEMYALDEPWSQYFGSQVPLLVRWAEIDATKAFLREEHGGRPIPDPLISLQCYTKKQWYVSQSDRFCEKWQLIGGPYLIERCFSPGANNTIHYCITKSPDINECIDFSLE